jgi:hypothetical protein
MNGSVPARARNAPPLDTLRIPNRFEGEHALHPNRHYPRCVAGACRAPLEDSGGAEIFMDRQIPDMPAARKSCHAERKLRDMAKLLEEAVLEDVAFRARSRAILGRRRKPVFDRQAANDALDAAFSRSRRQPQELGHGDSNSIDR